MNLVYAIYVINQAKVLEHVLGCPTLILNVCVTIHIVTPLATENQKPYDDRPAHRNVSFHGPSFYRRHYYYYYYYSDARTDTVCSMHTNARARPSRFCMTYTATGPKHPSFYILISVHDSKFNTILYHRTGVALYEDDTRGEYARTHTHVGK